jgi:hypothetical protein
MTESTHNNKHIKHGEAPMDNRRQISTEDARVIGTKLGINWSEISLVQFRRGLEIELKRDTHELATIVTDDDLIMTGNVVWAHLKEFQGYYTR